MHYSGFIKGVMAGMIVGAAVTMISDPVSDRQRHKIKKKTEGVFKSIGNVIDTAVHIMQ